MPARVTGCAYRGTDTTYRIKLETGLDMVVREQNIAGRRDKFSVGDGVALLIAPGAARILADEDVMVAQTEFGDRATWIDRYSSLPRRGAV